jgi:sodium/bile acid cotransporter 7
MAATKLDILWDLCLKLLFPFALGQLSRRWTKDFIEHHDGLLAITDRLSVIFIVFVSFSGATVEGLWHLLDLTQFLIILLCCMVILALALTITAVLGKLLNFKIEDRISIIFCGSKKSLMAGVPMAGIIFSPSIAGLIILPLMIFHQLQLLVCAQIARKFASRKPEED